MLVGGHDGQGGGNSDFRRCVVDFLDWTAMSKASSRTLGVWRKTSSRMWGLRPETKRLRET